MKVKLLVGGLTIRGELRAVGDELELPEELAARLAREGRVEVVREKKKATKAGDDGPPV